MTYTAPNGGAYPIYDKLLDQYHVLIAGQTRSGKSVTEKGLIYNLVNMYTPEEAEIYLIDPKMVDLEPWRSLPHVRDYADNPEDAVSLLEGVKDRMMERYAILKREGKDKWDGSHIYIFIDEMADILDDGGKEFMDILKKLLRLGAAARIHIIGLSQFAKKAAIPAMVIDNFTCNVGLKMRDAVASRQIIHRRGCEELKLGGHAIIAWESGEYEEVHFPMYTDTHYIAMRRYYSAQRFEIYKAQSEGR